MLFPLFASSVSAPVVLSEPVVRCLPCLQVPPAREIKSKTINPLTPFFLTNFGLPHENQSIFLVYFITWLYSPLRPLSICIVFIRRTLHYTRLKTSCPVHHYHYIFLALFAL